MHTKQFAVRAAMFAVLFAWLRPVPVMAQSHLPWQISTAEAQAIANPKHTEGVLLREVSSAPLLQPFAVAATADDRVIEPDLSLLDRLDRQTSHVLTLAFTPGHTAAVVLDSREDHTGTNFTGCTWHGHLAGQPDSLLLLTVIGDAVVMQADVPEKGKYYLRRENGQYLFGRMNPALRLACGATDSPVLTPAPSAHPQNQVRPQVEAQIQPLAGPTVVTLACFYSEEVAAAHPNVNDIIATFTNAIAYANTCHTNSQTNVQLQIAGTVAKISGFYESGYQTSGSFDFNKALSGFSTNSAANSTRSALKANLCSILVTGTSPGGSGAIITGLGNVLGDYQNGYNNGNPAAPPSDPTLAYSVVSYDFAVSGTLAHETGHNFGCGHSKQSTGSPSSLGCYSFSHGYDFSYSNALPQNTIMAYTWQLSGQYSKQIPYFSSPLISYKPAGASFAQAIGDASIADNARTVRLNAANIALYYQTTTWYVDNHNTVYNPTGRGSSANPFGSLAEAVYTGIVQAGNTVLIRGGMTYNEGASNSSGKVLYGDANSPFQVLLQLWKDGPAVITK